MQAGDGVPSAPDRRTLGPPRRGASGSREVAPLSRERVRKARRSALPPPVPQGALEPHLPRPLRRRGGGPPPRAVRGEGEDRPRHAAGVHHPLRAARALRQGAPADRVLRRRDRRRREVLPDGAAAGRGAARPGSRELSAGTAPRHVHRAGREPRRPACGGRVETGAFVDRASARIRTAPGGGMVRPLRERETDEIAEIEAVQTWVNANVPPESGAAVVHNDYKYDNVMLDPSDLTRIVAVLDWEMATVGDPLFDLGTLLGYWSDADDPPELRLRPYGPTFLPGSLSRKGVVEAYAKKTGRSFDPLFYYVFALFKIAVIVQQIYKRFVEGSTSDPRFRALGEWVRVLGRQAALALDKGRIDRLGTGS